MTQVSVIIPNYNRSGLVNQTVRNVLGQTLAPAEVIVVDDGSTDDSVESLKNEFGDQIELIQQSNQGPGAARNAGLDRATGEFVWLMDSDDLASLNKLETQVDALQRAQADVVYSPWARVFLDRDQIELDGPVLQQRALPESRSALAWFLTDWSLVLQQCLIKRTALENAGRYRTDLRMGEDGEYFVRILDQGAKVTFDDRSLLIYRCDDFGKLTAGGSSNSRRMTDWAKCLIAMHDQVGAESLIAKHPQFQQRIWDALQDLRENCPDESDLIQKLQERLSGSGFAFRSQINRVGKAIRRRVTGTHWSGAYQVGQLHESQMHLIKQLGFKMSGDSTS